MKSFDFLIILEPKTKYFVPAIIRYFNFYFVIDQLNYLCKYSWYTKNNSYLKNSCKSGYWYPNELLTKSWRLGSSPVVENDQKKKKKNARLISHSKRFNSNTFHFARDIDSFSKLWNAGSKFGISYHKRHENKPLSKSMHHLEKPLPFK